MPDNLRRTVADLNCNSTGTVWADYDGRTSYSDEATRAKEHIVEAMLREAGGSAIWDLGANVGRFSGIAARLGRRVVAWDQDPVASECTTGNSERQAKRMCSRSFRTS